MASFEGEHSAVPGSGLSPVVDLCLWTGNLTAVSQPFSPPQEQWACPSLQFRWALMQPQRAHCAAVDLWRRAFFRTTGALPCCERASPLFSLLEARGPFLKHFNIYYESLVKFLEAKLTKVCPPRLRFPGVVSVRCVCTEPRRPCVTVPESRCQVSRQHPLCSPGSLSWGAVWFALCPRLLQIQEVVDCSVCSVSYLLLGQSGASKVLAYRTRL